MSSERQDLVKRLNEALNELHLLWRKEHSKSMDVFLRTRRSRSMAARRCSATCYKTSSTRLTSAKRL